MAAGIVNEQDTVGPPGQPTGAKRVAAFHHQAREGLTMCDPRFWIEVLIVILRIFSAGLSS
jgi:hypothetical protein